MEDVKTLPLREDISNELTWDLTTIYVSDEKWEEDFEKLKQGVANVSRFKGELTEGAHIFQEALEAVLELSRKISSLYVYAHLKNDQDTANSTYQAMNDKARYMIAQAQEATSWFEPEVIELSESVIKGYFNDNKELERYRHYIEQMTANKAHVLSSEMEALLAGASEVLNSSAQTFSVLNNADLKFPEVKNDKGETVQLSHGMFGELMESTDRRVREQAFKKMYAVYKDFKNTFASTLAATVKNHNYLAKVHNYSSARESALSTNHIPEAVHDTLIEVVNDHLPLLHRYMMLRKQVLELDELHMYDLYTPITGEASLKYSYDEAKAKTYEGLQPLGDEYKAVLDQAFHNRWIDVVENKGKRSGAYSSGTYDTNPFILLNWHDSLNHLYTLVHELGHSAHSYFTRDSQPYVYGNYSIFLAEIASTTNENLLTDYLLKTTEDPKARAYVLSHYLDGFKGTVFRQTQFAEFEHLMHVEADKGTPLTADYLSEQYQQINSKYYGESVKKDEEIQYEWARIPHFYYNYYVYQYSTGFCAATALADSIIKEEKGALDAYLMYLKAGSSDYPIQVMQKAGVDMTSRDYLLRAMAVFEERVDELEKALEAIK